MTEVKKDFKAMEVDEKLTFDYKKISKAVTKRGDQVMPGSTNMSAGLDGAIDVLNASKKPLAKKTIILMTDGLWNQGVDPIVSAQCKKLGHHRAHDHLPARSGSNHDGENRWSNRRQALLCG